MTTEEEIKEVLAEANRQMEEMIWEVIAEEMKEPNASDPAGRAERLYKAKNHIAVEAVRTMDGDDHAEFAQHFIEMQQHVGSNLGALLEHAIMERLAENYLAAKKKKEVEE